MALESSDSYAPAAMNELIDANVPIFNVERVSLQFSVSSDFVAAQVANNVLVVALATGRILRIDLDNAADIDGMARVASRMLYHLKLTTARYRPTKEVF